MTTFDDRERAEEARFAHNEEIMFKARARRDHYIGLWAAEKLGLSGDAASAYADDIVAADLKSHGDDGVIAKLNADLGPKGVAEHTIRHELADLMTKAVAEVKGA